MSIKDYLKTADEGKEKHVPDIDVKDCPTCGEMSVTIQVGKDTLHPSTPEHFIKTIILYGVTEKGVLEELTVFQLGEQNTVPRVKTSVKKGRYTKLLATSFCNIHGLWENEKSL